MKLFSLFKNKDIAQKPDCKTQKDSSIQEIIDHALEHDYLGKAATVRNNAKKAIKEKNYDEAWRLFHEEKSYFLKHSVKSEFTTLQTLSLNATISESLANILRLQGKHDDAIIHILYWVICYDRRTSKQQQKLVAYFNRSSFKKISFSTVEEYINKNRSNVDFKLIQDQVKKWRIR